MIKNVIFDYGGVIVNLYNEDVKAALTSLGVGPVKQVLYAKRIKRLMRQLIDGLVPNEVTLNEMLQMCRKGTTTEDLLVIIDRLCGELPKERLEAIKQLRGKYKVYLLSNINDLLWDSAKQDIKDVGSEWEDCFDDVFLSYAMKVSKPDPRIYQMVIEKTGIVPEETLYFDDRADNVQGGKDAGFQSVLVPTNHLEDLPEFQGLF